MNNDLFKILKELKGIRPDAEYSKKSKKTLFLELEVGDRKSGGFKFADVLVGFYSHKFKFILGTVSAIILVLVISGGVYYATKPVSQDELVVKASEANASIQVKLNEIQYLLQNQGKFNSNQISSIYAMLQNAANDLKAAASSKPEDLDKALQRIKSAEDMLYQIDELIK